MNDPIVLAYSGGLDTSFLVPYLKETYQVPIIAVHVNTGSIENRKTEAMLKRGIELGATEVKVIDAKRHYCDAILSYLIKGNVLRGDVYPLCVGAERVSQAMELANYAQSIKASKIAHGSTAAGNDQVRFQAYLTILAPNIETIAPIRDQAFSRDYEIEFLKKRGHKFDFTKSKYSINKGLWGTTIGAREFQNSDFIVPEDVFSKVSSCETELIDIQFERGLPVAIDGQSLPLDAVIEHLNDRAGKKGIGRGIHIGNTALGIKGRIAFEAPAAKVLIDAHRELEKLVMTKWQSYWKHTLSNFYGEHLHEGHYFDPAMRDIEAFVDQTQMRVSGSVRVALSEYRCQVQSCTSPYSLFDHTVGTYGESAQGWTGLEAKGFAKLGTLSDNLWWQKRGLK
ncbi:MAG: argininosuccinate synthase [Bdellovibrionales bacterium]|nr:argininosuccinate synthase [Bdellovibrionales bacterium]